MLMANHNTNAHGDVSTAIRQIMEQLEEKTELLFRLKKERQSIIEAECRMVPQNQSRQRSNY